jgi:hypothetical protein
VSIKWMNYVWEESPYEGKKLLLHLALADYASDEGSCFPSQPTLAHKARVSRVWVRAAIKEMIADGLLSIEQIGVGRGNRTVYKLSRKRVSELSFSEIKRVSELPEKGNSNYSLTIYKNHQEPSICAIESFEKFWKLYPRKVGKRAALKEFEKVLKLKNAPTVEHLLNAVKCYAKNAPEDQRYIAHPTTWLRQGRWEDESVIAEPQPVEHDYERDNTIKAVLTMRNAGYDLDRVQNFLATKRDDLREIGLTVFQEGITK